MSIRIAKSVFVLLIQIIGIILIALIGWVPLVLGVTYGILLVVFASIGTRGRMDLNRSPQYLLAIITAYYGLFVAFVVFPFPGDIEYAFLMLYNIPTKLGAVLLPLFGTLTVGMLWLNVWTKKHSKSVYALCAVAGVVFVLMVLFVSVASNYSI